MAFDSLLMVCTHCTVSTSRPTNAYVRHLPRHPAAHSEKARGRPSCNSVFHVSRPASSSAQIESHKVLRLSVGSTPGKSSNRTIKCRYWASVDTIGYVSFGKHDG